MRSRTCIVIAVCSILAAGSAIALERAGKNLVYHGSVISSEVTVISGRAYVPLSDVAKALGGKTVTRANGYEIVSSTGTEEANHKEPGGANEVRGQNGKIGDWFFNGYWRFKVISMERGEQYEHKYTSFARTNKPDGANDELVVLTCQIKNGHQQTEEPILAVNGLAAQKTALTDDQGQSFPPIDFDVRPGNLVQGASKTFAVIFAVPKGTQLKDMIFSIYGFGVTSTKATQVRVSLMQ